MKNIITKFLNLELKGELINSDAVFASVGLHDTSEKTLLFLIIS
jgi:hypothetical protein